jgi:hypothetical protein
MDELLSNNDKLSHRSKQARFDVGDNTKEITTYEIL